MTLAQARVEARQARVMLDKRQDPLRVRREAVQAERQRGSFKELCEDWYRGEVTSRHELPHFTIHDLRRTARTHMAALGVRREVAERCLGHKERRVALGQWVQVLLDAERGKSNVTPIRRA